METLTPFQQILQITLDNVQKLLADHRIGENADDDAYQDSQFNTVYNDPPAYPVGVTMYSASDHPSDYPDYPLTPQEVLDLQHLRVIEYIQLGFVPIEDLENIDCTSLFIANATDRQRIEPGDTTLNQVSEVIPLNFRLMTKQPGNHELKDTNIVIVEKVLEGLKYVLNPDDYINLTFERRGYDQDTVIRNIEFVRALNLEEFMSPYEVVDYLFQITIREQRSRSKST